MFATLGEVKIPLSRHENRVRSEHSVRADYRTLVSNHMNRVEAKWLLLRELVGWRSRPYDELKPLIGHTECFERVAGSGVKYQIEMEPVWDDKPNGDIRVLGSIDDGGVRAFCPLGYGVLISKRGGA